MFLPCIDGDWDKSRWTENTWQAAQRERFDGNASDAKRLQFWPLTEADAAGESGSVLSGEYVRDWSRVAQEMAKQGDNDSFDGTLTKSSFWSDFNTRPTNFFDKITAPTLWIMATEDVVCGPLEFTKHWYEKLACPKSLCVLEGEHLAQYFDPGFPKGLTAMLDFVRKHAT